MTIPFRRRLGEAGRADDGSGGNVDPGNVGIDTTTASFPFTTAALLWAIHMIYYLQWFRRKRKRNHQYHRPKASYNRLLEQKKFHLVWTTTLSVLLPAPRKSERNATTTDREGTTDRSTTAGEEVPPAQHLSIPMGNAGIAEEEEMRRRVASMSLRERWTDRLVSHRVIRSLLQRLDGARHHPILRRLGSTVDQSVLQPCGGLAMVLRLCYHTHLLWSCRALEASAASSWAYLCCLTTLVFGGLAAELYFEHAFLTQYTSSSSSSIGFPDDNDNDAFVRRFLRKEIRHRRLIALSLSSLTAMVVTLFRQEFPYVSIPILPFLPGYGSGPVLSHFLCLLLLGLVSSRHYRHVYVEIWWGCGVGWCGGALLSSMSSYWGTPIVALGLVLLPLLSLRVRQTSSSSPWWLGWIEHVGWNRRGKLLVLEEATNEWVEYEPWIGIPDDSDDSDTRRSEMDEEEEKEDDYGGGADGVSTTDEDDYVDSVTTELTPLVGDGASNMRSRRNAS